MEPWRYQHLQPYGQRLIREWFSKGQQGLGCAPEDSFEPFIYTWFAFNSWAACVTDEDKDYIWRNSLAQDSDLQSKFDDLRARSTKFQQQLHQFVAFWPIFEVKGIRRDYPEYRQYRTPDTRAELLPELQARGIPHEPDGWNPGDAVTWPLTLAALARVRNNLFHGDKAPDDLVDQRIVHAALHTLVYFLRDTQLLEPSGQY